MLSKIRSLNLNGISIQSRNSDNYINATQICKAGGKKFNDWHRLENTKVLIETIYNMEKLKTGIPVLNIIDVKVGGCKSGTWIHPDLAVQLAQWVSPHFAIQVSRWIRELFTLGSVSISDGEKEEDKKEDNTLVIENQQLRDELERFRIQNLDLLTYKKLNAKEETIYIVSTLNYASQGIYKVGRTRNTMRARNIGHNVCSIPGDKVFVLGEFKVHDCKLLESDIHSKLKGIRVHNTREFYQCPFDLLYSLVDMIVHNDEQVNDCVNRIIDTVSRLQRQIFQKEDWMSGLPHDVFREDIMILSDEREHKLDVSEWTFEERHSFVQFCLNEYIERTQKRTPSLLLIENNVSLTPPPVEIQWKEFQTFLISELKLTKTQFKAKEWKPFVKKQIDQNENCTMQWRMGK
jgi:hypothetical protein